MNDIPFDWVPPNIKPEACIGCPAPCLEVCPTDAPARNVNGFVEIDPAACTVSSGCVSVCPHDALEWSFNNV